MGSSSPAASGEFPRFQAKLPHEMVEFYDMGFQDADEAFNETPNGILGYSTPDGVRYEGLRMSWVIATDEFDNKIWDGFYIDLGAFNLGWEDVPDPRSFDPRCTLDKSTPYHIWHNQNGAHTTGWTKINFGKDAFPDD